MSVKLWPMCRVQVFVVAVGLTVSRIVESQCVIGRVAAAALTV